MRTLNKNKQKMYYSLFLGDLPVYERRNYTNYLGEIHPDKELHPLNEDEENIVYIEIDGVMVPVETGETKLTYGRPVEFSGNIKMAGGKAEAESFGLNVGDYEAVLLLDKNEVPITETSKIWFESEPEYNEDGTVNYFKADYTVVKPFPSINNDRYALKKVVK